MDAYDLYQKLKWIWASMAPKNSGELSKSKNQIVVCVLVDGTYKTVVGIKENESGFIELELEK